MKLEIIGGDVDPDRTWYNVKRGIIQLLKIQNVSNMNLTLKFVIVTNNSISALVYSPSECDSIILRIHLNCKLVFYYLKQSKL